MNTFYIRTYSGHTVEIDEGRTTRVRVEKNYLAPSANRGWMKLVWASLSVYHPHLPGYYLLRFRRGDKVGYRMGHYDGAKWAWPFNLGHPLAIDKAHFWEWGGLTALHAKRHNCYTPLPEEKK